MRTIILTTSILLLLFTSRVLAQGNISVLVTTNVNDFTCECKETDFKYTETYTTSVKKVKILFPLVAFNCPKKLMEKDLQKLFESEKFPYAKLTVVSFDSSEGQIILQLSLKDKTKEYKLQLAKTEINKRSYLKGSQTIKLKDYNVVPPTKMMGLVKVSDEVTVSFMIPEEELLAEN